MQWPGASSLWLPRLTCPNLEGILSILSVWRKRRHYQLNIRSGMMIVTKYQKLIILIYIYINYDYDVFQYQICMSKDQLNSWHISHFHRSYYTQNAKSEKRKPSCKIIRMQPSYWELRVLWHHSLANHSLWWRRFESLAVDLLAIWHDDFARTTVAIYNLYRYLVIPHLPGEGC